MIFIEWVARWLVTIRLFIFLFISISCRASRWACLSLAAMTTIMDETRIGLHGIPAGRDMKIMQANQRSCYIKTVPGSS